MRKFILKRLLQGLIVVFGVIVITFVVTRVVPSNPALQCVGDRATPEQLAAAEEKLGLNEPLLVQFGIYMRDLLHGDLGNSLKSHRHVTTEIAEKFPAKLELVLLGTAEAIIIGLGLGGFSANHKGRSRIM